MDEKSVRTEQGSGDTRKRLNYTPRFIPPKKDNECYYSNKNIFYKAGYGLPNCTCLAYGRLLENTGKGFTKLTGNGGKWYSQALSAGYKVGPFPKLGAVVCWDNGKAGHVATVEKIYADGSIVCSNSAWKGTLFYTTTHYKAQGYNFGNYKLQGFIYME